MTSADLLPAAVLKRKAVVYVDDDNGVGRRIDS